MATRLPSAKLSTWYECRAVDRKDGAEERMTGLQKGAMVL
jgi:hypothetical protein